MKHLILISICCSISFFAKAQKNDNQLVAVQHFLKTLDKDQLLKASFAFDSTERFRWFYVPIARKGLPINEMNPIQKEAAMALINASLSQQGHQKVLEIMQLEIILKEIEHRKPEDDYRDTGKYYISIFGKPDAIQPWGWRLDGHHVSLNFSSLDGKIASATPSFMGSNPETVLTGQEAGKEILKEESDLGFEMLNSLTEQQRVKAIRSPVAPDDILTRNDKKANISNTEGIVFGELDKTQQQKLLKLIALYTKRYPFEFADEFMAKIQKAGFEQLRFVWFGSLVKGKGHYYRIQNSVLLIEYDNVQNNANHAHTVVRDLSNDWAEDLIQKHYALEHSKK